MGTQPHRRECRVAGEDSRGSGREDAEAASPRPMMTCFLIRVATVAPAPGDSTSRSRGVSRVAREGGRGSLGATCWAIRKRGQTPDRDRCGLVLGELEPLG